jgi:hypothetical protein
MSSGPLKQNKKTDVISPQKKTEEKKKKGVEEKEKQMRSGPHFM